MNTGIVEQVIGQVVDVRFHPREIPSIHNALIIERRNQKNSSKPLVLEVQSHFQDGLVRCISIQDTSGLQRGMEVIDTEKPIQVPVGKETLGRMFNVLGEPSDGKPPVKAKQKMAIHRSAPPLTERSGSTQVFETGIKIIDLLCPYITGGKPVYLVVLVLVRQC